MFRGDGKNYFEIGLHESQIKCYTDITSYLYYLLLKDQNTA